jgi:hypothetical protein
MDILVKKVMDFEKIISYDMLKPREIRFLEEIIKPSMLELDMSLENQKILLNRYKAIVENRTKYDSVFPVKEYDRELIDVEGIRKIGPLDEMTRKLVLGLISRKPEIVLESYEFYQPDVLQKIANSIGTTRIYNRVKDLIGNTPSKNPDENKANTRKILETIINPECSNNSTLNQIAYFILKNLDDPSIIQSPKTLVTRTSERTIDLSISYGKHGCCAFWGIVEREEHYRRNLDSRYHSSTLYLTDPEIGLIFHYIDNIPGQDGDKNTPTGVVITSRMIGENITKGSTRILGESKKEKVLLVDSIEAYRPDWDRTRFPDNPLREMKNDIWRRLTYNTLFQVAKDIGASKILYNTDFWNEGGNTFTQYMTSRMENEGINFQYDQKFHVKKESGRKYIPSYYTDNFGYFIDCITPQDSEHFEGAHAIKGNMNCEGIANVISIDLK